MSLRQKIDDYNENVQIYEDMRAALKWEQWDMESKAGDLGDSDSAAAPSTPQRGDVKAVGRPALQADRPDDRERSQRNIEKAADAATMTAQAMMNSYNQMTGNARARASAEAAEAACGCRSPVRAGLATQADVRAPESA